MQVLFDPFEKQLDLPSTFVKFCNRQRRQREVVGQEHKPPVVLGVVEHDATKGVGVKPRRLRAYQHDRLVAPKSCRLVDPPTGSTGEVEATFGSCHEERRRRREPMKTSKIDRASVQHIKCAGLDWQMIENCHIVGFAVSNPHESGNVAVQIQKGVQLYGPFATTESRPGEQTQTKVDRGTVEGIDSLLQLHAEGFVGVELPRSTDQHLSEIGKDAPVVSAVG